MNGKIYPGGPIDELTDFQSVESKASAGRAPRLFKSNNPKIRKFDNLSVPLCPRGEVGTVLIKTVPVNPPSVAMRQGLC